jgi:sialic acid synthase SpsE
MDLQVTFKTPLCNIQIGDGLPTHLIAEIGLNHNGSLDLAKQMVLQVALSGATFVKFQKRTPEILTSSEFLDSSFSKCPSLGSTQREVRKRLELTIEAYKELKKYAEQLGLIFSASAFDLPSLDFLMELDTPVIKVASHSITNAPLLKKIAEYKIPTICSFGGTTEGERDRAFDILQSNPLIIFHCVSSYPTPDFLVKLDTIS